jgi:hypothetical protein
MARHLLLSERNVRLFGCCNCSIGVANPEEARSPVIRYQRDNDVIAGHWKDRFGCGSFHGEAWKYACSLV